MSRAAQLKGRSPGQVLAFFLSEGAAVQALHDEVGIVSCVRRAFEQLNAVIRRHEDERDTKSHEDADDTPQRIVFYIDDLDRCRAEQVVHVLEAVHLLLAFDRFVVVVVVDTRWLELISFYDEQLRANRDSSDGRNGLAPDPRATVRDYIEKIFQVLIQIPRLTTEEGGTYGKLVEILSPVSAPSSPTQEDQGADAARYRDLRPIEPLDVTMPEPERFREAVARAQLTAEEVELLKQLGPLAGRSPRAVKRFLNLYRLLRATRTGAGLTEFLEGSSVSGGWPDYPAVQLCLAVEVGLPAAHIHRFREAVIVAASGRDTKLSDVLVWPVRLKQPWSDAMLSFFEALSPTQPREQVGALLRTIVERFGNSPPRLLIFRDIVLETSRFSFSPLGDRPSPESANEAAPVSASATQKPRRVRKPRKPPPNAT